MLIINVKVKQVDFEHVLICYDAEDADGDSMTVSVITSSPSMYRNGTRGGGRRRGIILAVQVRRSCGLSLRMWPCISTVRVMWW